MTVSVEIHARNFEPTPRLREHVEKKLAGLDRFLEVLEEARAELRLEKTARSPRDRHVAQVTVSGKGVRLRAEERSSEMRSAVDAVVEKLHRQMRRYKGRHWNVRGGRRSGTKQRIAPPKPATKADPVFRIKRVALSPMDRLEAIEQMNLLGHDDFFVFLEAQTQQVHVLYRRRDGSLGLIETELA